MCDATIDCTRKWIGNAAYIVYVTSLAILRHTAFYKVRILIH